jgi:hypothetical protein
VRRKPEAGEAAALAALDEELAATSDDATAEELQNIVYEIGKDPATASKACATGSRRCMKRCWPLRQGRAWAASSRCMGGQHAQVDR